MHNFYFDHKKRANLLTRSDLSDVTDSGFLFYEAAQIIAERLQVTNRNFAEVALLLDGPFAENIAEIIAPTLSIPQHSIELVPLTQIEQSTDMPSENANLGEEKFDLIISIFDLHWFNDLPGMMTQINTSLKPDGLFMAALPSDGTLQELNETLVSVESKFRSGATIRVGPFAQVRQLGDLLRRADFKLPVADLEQRTVNYSSFTKLISDLRNCSATNANNAKVHLLTKEIFKGLEAHYMQFHATASGKLIASANIAFLSGWKEHESQQKPLKRGSAKKPLADILSRSKN